jgi:hypothetical protein
MSIILALFLAASAGAVGPNSNASTQKPVAPDISGVTIFYSTAGIPVSTVTSTGDISAPKLFSQYISSDAGNNLTLTNVMQSVFWDNIIREDSITTLSAGLIVINTAGWYRVSYSAESQSTTAADVYTNCVLVSDFGPIWGSNARGFTTTSGQSSTCTGSVVFQAGSGSTLNLDMESTLNGETATTSNGNGCPTITIELMEAL